MSAIARIVTRVIIGVAALASIAVYGAERQNESSLEEIIVTAQRRDESLQKVPVSMSAINQETLERAGIRDFADYATAVPGVSLPFAEGPSGARGRRTVGIRGVQRFSGLTDSTVGFYVDDTPIDIATNPAIVDIERIEVLRGPQGTLYGSGSMGGNIRLITHQPDPSAFSGDADATYSITDSGGDNYDVSGVLNMPLAGDRAALRVVGVYRDESGFIDNRDLAGNIIKRDVDAQKTRAGRAALLLAPSDRLTITPSIFYQEYTLDSEPAFVENAGFESFAKNEFVQTSSAVTTLLANLTIRYQLGFGAITSSTSWFKNKNQSFEDITSSVNLILAGLPRFLPAPITALQEQRSWTHETRLVSQLDGPLQYIAGVFYENRAAPFSSSSFVPGLTARISPPLPPLFPPDPRGDNLFNVVATRDQKQIAAFGEASYELTKALKLTAGLRWFNFESSSTDAFDGFLFGGSAASNPGVRGEGGGKDNGVNPRVSLAYQPNDDHLLYVSAAKGFRGGGSNIPLPSLCDASLIARGITPPAPREFTSDALWNYEIGAKTAWFDDRATLNVAAYYMDWKDLQLLVPTSPPCRIQGLVANAGAARSRGAELELAARPVHNVDLNMSVAYIDSELTEDSRILGAPAGSKILFVSPWTATGSVQVHFPVSTSLEAYARADARYRDKAPLDFSGTMSDSYVEEDVRLGLLGEGWEIALFVENLSNASPLLSRDPRVGLPGFQSFTLRPRTVGFNLKKSF